MIDFIPNLTEYKETTAFLLLAAMAVGYMFRAKQDALNKDYLKNMLEATEKKLYDSDRICNERVETVRSDLTSLADRHEREIESMRKIHSDEVKALRAIVDSILDKTSLLAKDLKK